MHNGASQRIFKKYFIKHVSMSNIFFLKFISVLLCSSQNCFEGCPTYHYICIENIFRNISKAIVHINICGPSKVQSSCFNHSASGMLCSYSYILWSTFFKSLYCLNEQLFYTIMYSLSKTELTFS